MKNLIFFSIAFIAIGCTSNDRTGAGAPGPLPPPPSMSTVSNARPQTTRATDSAANGGSSLPASTPYQGEGAPIAQNINPAPFLTASSPPGQAPGPVSAPANALASRADGTMVGPNDLPAASTGWGTPTPSTVPATAPRTKARPSNKK